MGREAVETARPLCFPHHRRHRRDPMGLDASQMMELLRNSQTIAVVGISAKEDRPSHRVAAYLQRVGYRIIPVNPGLKELLGETCYPTLEAIPQEIPVDIVDVFRAADQTPPIAQEAVKIGAKAFWLQSGILSEESMTIARQAGLTAVQDLCLMVEHRAVADRL
ncbi:MAG: CoA-binding protein [Magnetococcales bacterium]|nr:CoA-binding protein [Magnetococcales bacterium]